MISTAEIRSLLRRLDGAPADDLESETLDCKRWDPSPEARARQIRELREHVVCFANARGGTILLGVGDGHRSRSDAIHGVATLDPDAVRREVYRGTVPPILVHVEEVVEPEGRVLAVHVPPGVPPHSTTEGVSKVRVGKDCQPLVGSQLVEVMLRRSELDLTARVVPDATTADLDPEEVKRIATVAGTEGRKPDLARVPPNELLSNLGLVRPDGVTLAAILLAGTSPAIARFAPQHEVAIAAYGAGVEYEKRSSFKGPLLAVLEAIRALIEPLVKLDLVRASGFGEISLPSITQTTAREALLNALVHRDWFVRQEVLLEVRPDRLVVASPGGFVGGVTPENVLRHAPMRRNPLLADVLEKLGLVNRAGMGVDRIYEELLRLGKGPPRYEADEASVTLTLPTQSQPAFAGFIAEETRAGRQPSLDDLILLRGAIDRGQIDRFSAARLLQLPDEQAAQRLVDLRERELLSVRGRGRSAVYTLSRWVSDQVRGPDATNVDLAFDQAAARDRVRSLLAERGRLTNAEIRRLTGCARLEVVRMMAALRKAGEAALVGRGRGAAWVPAAKPEPRTRRKGGRK